MPWAALSADANTGWQNPGWLAAPATVTTDVVNTSGGTETERTFAVQWRVTDVGTNVCLRDVEVRVRWTEEKMSVAKQHVLATRRYDWGGASC